MMMENNGRQLYIVFISVVTALIVLLGVTVFGEGFGKNKHLFIEESTFDSAWAYREKQGSDIKIDVPGQVETEKGESIKLINRLPEVIPDNTVLLIETGYQRVNVEIDGEVLLNNSGDKVRLSSEPFPSFYIVDIPDGAAGDEISVSLTSDKKRDSGQIGRIFLGSYGDVLLRLLLSDLFVTVFGALFLILAIILFFVRVILVLPKNRGYELNYVNWLMGFSGIYLVSTSSIAMLVAGNTAILFVTRLCTVLLIPIAYCLYLLETARKKKLIRFINVAIYILFANALIAIVLSFFAIVEIEIYTRIATWIFILITAVLTFLIIVAGAGYRQKHLIYLGATNIIFYVFAIIEMIFDHTERFMGFKGLMLGIGIILWISMIAFHTESRLVYGIKREREAAKNSKKKERHELLRSLTPDSIFSGFAMLLGMMKEGDKDAPRFLVEISDYVRMRFNHIQYDENKVVDFSEEMRGILSVLDISMRKSKSFSYETEFKAVDFKVPFGSIIAFVDNAIIHGAAEGKIHISVKSYETDMGYVIQIADTGKGFLVEEIKSRGEYGILNSIDRLNSLCSAEVDLRSKEGQGTVATIKIYDKREKEKENG